MVDAFFLKLQRDNRKNALAVDPAKGKTGKKLYFHRTMEMKQLHAITEPYFEAVLKFPADTAIRGRSSAPVSAEHSLP